MRRAGLKGIVLSLPLLLACSSGESSTAPPGPSPTRAPIIGLGSLCGGCDPFCFVAHDAPAAADLVPENSRDLSFVSGDPGGVATTAATGLYTHGYDARLDCAGQLVPYWFQLYYDVVTPPGTEIAFTARTAEAASALATAAPVPLSGGSPTSLDGAFEAEGLPADRRYLQVEVELRAAPDGSSPILRSLDVVYYCTCSCDLGSGCDDFCDCDDDC